MRAMAVFPVRRLTEEKGAIKVFVNVNGPFEGERSERRLWNE